MCSEADHSGVAHHPCHSKTADHLPELYPTRTARHCTVIEPEPGKTLSHLPMQRLLLALMLRRFRTVAAIGLLHGHSRQIRFRNVSNSVASPNKAGFSASTRMRLLARNGLPPDTTSLTFSAHSTVCYQKQQQHTRTFHHLDLGNQRCNQPGVHARRLRFLLYGDHSKATVQNEWQVILMKTYDQTHYIPFQDVHKPLTRTLSCRNGYCVIRPSKEPDRPTGGGAKPRARLSTWMTLSNLLDITTFFSLLLQGASIMASFGCCTDMSDSWVTGGSGAWLPRLTGHVMSCTSRVV